MAEDGLENKIETKKKEGILNKLKKIEDFFEPIEIIGPVFAGLLGIVIALSYIHYSKIKENAIKEYLHDKFVIAIDIDGNIGISFKERTDAYRVLDRFKSYRFDEGQKFPELSVEDYGKILDFYRKK